MDIKEFLDSIGVFRKSLTKTKRVEVVVDEESIGPCLSFSWSREVKYLGRYSSKCTYQKRGYVHRIRFALPAGLYTVYQKAEELQPRIKENVPESLSLICTLLQFPGIEENHIHRYETLSKAIFNKGVPVFEMFTLLVTWKDLSPEETVQASREWRSLRELFPDKRSAYYILNRSVHYILNRRLLLGGVNYIRFADKFYPNEPFLSDKQFFDSYCAWACVLQDQFSARNVKEIFSYVLSCYYKHKDVMLTSLGLHIPKGELAYINFVSEDKLLVNLHNVGTFLASLVFKAHEDNDKPLPEICTSSRAVMKITTIKEGREVGKNNGWCISGVRHYWDSFLARKAMLYCVKRGGNLILVQQDDFGNVLEAKKKRNRTLTPIETTYIKKIAKGVKFKQKEITNEQRVENQVTG